MANKGLIAIILGALATGITLSATTKTVKVVKTANTLNRINNIKKADNFQLSPKKVFDGVKTARDLKPIFNNEDQGKDKKKEQNRTKLQKGALN